MELCRTNTQNKLMDGQRDGQSQTGRGLSSAPTVKSIQASVVYSGLGNVPAVV